MSAASSSSSATIRVIRDIRTILRIKKKFPSFRLPFPITMSTSPTSSSGVSIPNLNPVNNDDQNGDTKNLRHDLLSVIRMHSDNIKSEEEMKVLRSALSSYAELLSSLKESKYLRGLDSGERLDPRDKISRTAARVGFAMPKFSDDGDALHQPLGKLPSNPK